MDKIDLIDVYDRMSDFCYLGNFNVNNIIETDIYGSTFNFFCFRDNLNKYDNEKKFYRNTLEYTMQTHFDWSFSNNKDKRVIFVNKNTKDKLFNIFLKNVFREYFGEEFLAENLPLEKFKIVNNSLQSAIIDEFQYLEKYVSCYDDFICRNKSYKSISESTYDELVGEYESYNKIKLIDKFANMEIIGNNIIITHGEFYFDVIEAERRIFNEYKKKKFAKEENNLASRSNCYGNIYFIVNENNDVKIGFTEKDPNKRMRALQTGSSEKLMLLFCIKGTMNDEKALHKKFAAHRKSGEWFSMNEQLDEFITSRIRSIQT